MTFHAAVWLDHHEARVFHVTAASAEETTLRAPTHHLHHAKKGERSSAGTIDHATAELFDSVAKTLSDAGEILLMGPGPTKLAFLRHVHQKHHALEPKIVGVESADHPSDGQIVAHVRAYFRTTDPLR